VEFGEWLCQEVVKAVPHQHVVLGIPKILRRYFLYDRKLLSDLSRCGWLALKLYLKKAVRDTGQRMACKQRRSTPWNIIAFIEDEDVIK
jgi:hypothetical protein